MATNDDIINLIQALKSSVEERFDRVDGRLDRVDGRLDLIDGRFDKIEGGLERLENRFDEFEKFTRSQFQGLSILLLRIEESQTSLAQRVLRIERKVS